MNRRVWLVPAENRRTIGVDAGARPVKVLRLCSRTRGASEALCGAGLGLRCLKLCRQGRTARVLRLCGWARSDTSSGQRCLERRWFGTTLFGAALFGVMPVWGGGCNPAGRLFIRNSFLLHNLFLSPIIAANLTGEFVCYGKDEQKEKAGTRGEAQVAEACIVRRRHEFCPLPCHQQRRPAEEGV